MLENGDMTLTLTSKETSVKNLDNASIRLEWDIAGTPVGEVVIQALQEKDNTNVEEADWFDLDFGSTITIDNTQTDHQLILTQLPFDKIRLRYTPTSGSGTLNAKITAKQVGG